MYVNIGQSNILTALDDEGTIGSKVMSGHGEFLVGLTKQIEALGDKFPGVAHIDMPTDYYHLVRCGAALRKGLRPRDCHFRDHRSEGLQGYALPSRAMKKFDSLTCLVFGIEIYLGDNEVGKTEAEALTDESVTHVLVAVHAGPSGLSYRRLISNINGGNQKWKPKLAFAGKDLIEIATGSTTINMKARCDENITLAEVRVAAAGSEAYEKEYMTVADALTETQEDDY